MKLIIHFTIFWLIAVFFIMCSSSKESTSSKQVEPPRYSQPRQGPPPFRSRNNNPAMDELMNDTYAINLKADNCEIAIEEKVGTKSKYREQIKKNEGIRMITVNSIANHNVGIFPNQGNPNTIQEQDWTFSIPLNPKIAKIKTTGRRYDTGVLFSGVTIDPFTAEFFTKEDGSSNREWNITTLTSTEDLGLDCNNAHVQPTGKYHYHGTPTGYLAELHYHGDKMLKIGYASDGFPIYYKYAIDENGELVEHRSGYQLKKGKRPGDGKNAPGGNYNGRYFNDYEFFPRITSLDECNGRWGKTPEREHEYFYVITDNFPSAPLCFSGTPSSELRKGGGAGGRPGGGPNGRRPPRPPRG